LQRIIPADSSSSAAVLDSTARILAAGVGMDKLVKINGQWLIQKRDVSPQE
jgi:hypothetical protein